MSGFEESAKGFASHRGRAGGRGRGCLSPTLGVKGDGLDEQHRRVGEGLRLPQGGPVAVIEQGGLWASNTI